MHRDTEIFIGFLVLFLAGITIGILIEKINQKFK